jgi:hypothetical protein
LFPHKWDNPPRTLYRSEKHEIHVVSELFLRKLHRIAESSRTGIVYEDVDATEFIGRLGDEVFVVLLLRDIGLYDQNFNSPAFQFIGRLIQGLFVPAADG